MSQFVWFLVSIFVLSPITALVEAATASKLWQWFVSPQYGAGPSYGSWYGILAIVTTILVITNLGRAPDDATKEARGKFWFTALLQVTIMLICALILFSAWLTGNIIGWL